jgi:hypothetical protein
VDDLYVNPILIGALIPIVLWVAMKLYQAKKSKEEVDKAKATFPVDKRNKQKEIELLADLLQDIKDNTHAWTYTNYDHSSMASSSIINDVKNIAIVIGQSSMLRTTTSIAVSYGLKDITKYNTHTPDNVCTHIQGRHVTEFCIQVEDCLDTRGHELDHFKEQIKSKL